MALAVEDLALDLLDVGQAAEGHPVSFAPTLEALAVADDQLLAAAGGDRKHAGRELVAGRLLEQGRVLAAVEKVLVGLAGGLRLDDLALLPAVAEPHRQAAHGGALGQGDAERALEGAVEGVVEGEAKLGEGERPGDDGSGLQGGQAQPGAVRRREAEGRADMARGQEGRFSRWQLGLDHHHSRGGRWGRAERLTAADQQGSAQPSPGDHGRQLSNARCHRAVS